MVIDNSDSDVSDGADEGDVAGVAYREALTSADGFTRGPGGRLKFNKDTKKRRRENAIEDADVEMDEAGAGKPGKKRSEVKIGHEFKAKVWSKLSNFSKKHLILSFLYQQKAGGDLKKKGGLDPYAYVPLRQAAKKRNRDLGLAGKR